MVSSSSAPETGPSNLAAAFGASAGGREEGERAGESGEPDALPLKRFLIAACVAGTGSWSSAGIRGHPVTVSVATMPPSSCPGTEQYTV